MTEPRPHISIGNRLLAALPREEINRLHSSPGPIRMASEETLYEAGDRLDFAYFITSGAVSLLSTTSHGESMEVAMVGREGVIGIPSLLRNKDTPYSARVQIGGEALRVKAEVLRAEFKRGGELQDLLLSYTHILMMQMAQSASCGLFHAVEQRLSRWLLASQDHAQSEALALTHESISLALGVSRSGISTAAGVLQKNGLIRYARGRITVLNRQGLEAAACECYQIIAEELDGFPGRASQPLRMNL